MNATVNENCIGCGLCAGTCPEVFHMGDDGLAHGSGIPEGQLEAAQEARTAARSAPSASKHESRPCPHGQGLLSCRSCGAGPSIPLKQPGLGMRPR